MEGKFQSFSLSDNAVYAIDLHSKQILIREGIFEKGYCSMGKEWKVMEIDNGIEISIIKSNNLGCLWALDNNNDVVIFYNFSFKII